MTNILLIGLSLYFLFSIVFPVPANAEIFTYSVIAPCDLHFIHQGIQILLHLSYSSHPNRVAAKQKV